MVFIVGKRTRSDVASFAAGEAYNLTILNQNSAMQIFCMYLDYPDFKSPSANPITLAWMTGSVAPGSIDNPSPGAFYWTVDYQATTGYIANFGDSQSPRAFKTSQSTGVKTQTDNQVSVSYQGNFPNGVPAFPDPATNGDKGIITVKADGTVPTNDQQKSKNQSLSIGVAMNRKPAMVVSLLPNLTYRFTTKPRYYIVSGIFSEGEIIDLSRITDPFEVSFPGVTDKTIIYTADNKFKSA